MLAVCLVLSVLIICSCVPTVESKSFFEEEEKEPIPEGPPQIIMIHRYNMLLKYHTNKTVEIEDIYPDQVFLGDSYYDDCVANNTGCSKIEGCDIYDCAKIYKKYVDEYNLRYIGRKAIKDVFQDLNEIGFKKIQLFATDTINLVFALRNDGIFRLGLLASPHLTQESIDKVMAVQNISIKDFKIFKNAGFAEQLPVVQITLADDTQELLILYTQFLMDSGFYGYQDETRGNEYRLSQIINQ
jgi:hypothetical protein